MRRKYFLIHHRRRAWYNHEHYHSGLGLMTPAQVHYQAADEAHAHRQQVLHAAYQATPERFVHGVPRPPDLPEAVWINKPERKHEDKALLQ